MTVKAYEPNTTLDARMRNLFFKSVEQSSEKVNIRNIIVPKFYLFDNCLGFYHSRLFTPVLFLAGKDEEFLESAFARINDTAANLYVSDETLDFGVTGSRGRKPLAQHGLQTPEWEPAERRGIKKFSKFLGYLVDSSEDISKAYELACLIEDGYRPLRVKEERKMPKKKSKK